MSEPFVGEIRLFAGTFAPRGWAFCDGELLSISEYETLYTLLGTTYGGDGATSFGVPDLRGRLPLHAGQGQGPGLSPYRLGQSGGFEEVTLLTTQLPGHMHGVLAQNGAGDKSSPTGAAPATASSALYSPYSSAATAMSNQALGAAGGNQPHPNMMPYLCLNFIIALFGIYPTQS